MTILDHFALDKPRKTQIETLNWVAKNISKKYIFCELPVGAGKSPIAVTVADYLQDGTKKSSFILTPQKILQNQYEKTFIKKDDDRYFKSLYGKSNYRCSGKGTTCDVGAIIKPKCGNCPHSNAVMTASKSEHVVMSYALAIRSFKYTKVFKKREVLIMDECHQLEDILTEYNNLTILKSACDKHHIKWNVSSSILNTYNWLENIYIPAMKDVCTTLEDECGPLLEDGYNITGPDIARLKTLVSMQEHIELLSEFVSQTVEEITEKYILNVDDKNIKFKYLYGAENFHNILEPMASKFLFLSATIFDHEEFCKNLNIPLSQTCFISMDSEFDVDNRPVLYHPIMKMNYGWNDQKNYEQRKAMVEAILNILNEHPTEKGIVHTGNFAIAQWLTSELRNSKHVILHHNPGSNLKRDTVIDQFTGMKKPALLISPSITEGLDLVDDKGRFAIFVKIPFGTLGDPWVKARMALSQKWYLLKAMTDVIQGGGRVVRTPEDYGTVYILDESFQSLYDRTKQYIPQWWKSALHKL
jgi:ATP-dependent DNA helicase DinG